MGSVVDYEECTQCGGIYYIDFNYRTGSEYGVCHCCGKSHHISVLRSDGKAIEDESGNWKYESKDKPGFGVCVISDIEGNGQLITFSNTPTTEEINELLSILKGKDVDAEDSYFCIWDAEKKQLNSLFGAPPKYADEFCGVTEATAALPEDSHNDDELPFYSFN